MKLSVGAKVHQYEIKSLLGVGGMGEVYLAHDTRLGRDVAIKFLKQTDDREKLARFRREAKIVSSLNHPNIVTIFEFNKYQNRHFIVTELVRGKLLRTAINDNSLGFSEILDIGIQIGNALAAAHEAGVIHRDIKPENIMILPDGYVKVLDFGLAKLADAGEEVLQGDDETTHTLIETRSGMILGTVSYMSPEQLRGKDVDERTDIWSLGICLYEMIISQRPFQGDTVSDIIVSVMGDEIPSLNDAGLRVSPEIEHIINTCLAKTQHERYESARDLVSDLKEARLMNTTGKTPSFISQIAKTQPLLTKIQEPQTTVHAKSGYDWLKYAAAIVLFAAIGLGGWFIYQNYFAQTAKQLRIKRLPTIGNVKNAAISPNGEFVAYVQSESGQESLWLRQTEEAGGKELIPAAPSSYGGLTFSPDGKHIYFTVFEKSSSGTLYRIPILAGSSRQEIARNVESAASVSPDGKQLAFIRNVPQESLDRIVLVGAEGGAERVLAEKKRPEFFFTTNAKVSLAWSPDSKTIAAPTGKTNADGDTMTVVEINVESGQMKEATAQKWFRVGRVAWSNQANELLITAAEIGSDLYQIFKISRSDGKANVVAPNLNDYFTVSLTKDSTRLLALALEKDARLFKAANNKPTRIEQIMGGGGEGSEGLIWNADGRIFYTSTANGNPDIWAADADGKNPRQITFDKAADTFPSVSADGKVVFVSLRSGAPHVWQTDVNGSGMQQLTGKGGESFPQITPDGKSVVFTASGEADKVLWKMPVDGGEAVQLTKSPTGWVLANWAAISPDGRTAACLSKEGKGEAPIQLSVISLDDGRFLQTFPLVGGVASPDLTPVLRWTADGTAIGYIATRNGISNIWLQPLAGGEPKQFTDFSAERIFSFDWSKDGKQIIYSRGVVRNSLVLIEDF